MKIFIIYIQRITIKDVTILHWMEKDLTIFYLDKFKFKEIN